MIKTEKDASITNSNMGEPLHLGQGSPGDSRMRNRAGAPAYLVEKSRGLHPSIEDSSDDNRVRDV
jgi:hypothetical protein